MTKPLIEPTVLALTLLAAVASLALVPAGYTWMASIAGLILLFTIFSFDDDTYRTVLQSLSFAGVCAFCLSVAAIIPYQYVYGLPTAREPQLVNRWMPLTCAFALLLFWVIDRARMSGRVTRPRAGAAAVGSMFSPAPIAETVSVTPPPITPTPIPPTPITSSPFTSSPFTPLPLTPSPFTSAPVTSAPVIPPPVTAPPVVASPMVTTVRTESAAPRLVRSETPVPMPAAPPPKLVEIYVRLTGEGLNLMRSVQAEALGRDYYRITDTMPETETWEFTPGMVVRCKKQNLSTGKAMVATEEAQRSN